MDSFGFSFVANPNICYIEGNSYEQSGMTFKGAKRNDASINSIMLERFSIDRSTSKFVLSYHATRLA